ncbi:MAG: histidyl-tRNA synthetase [Clostridia bacterium]|nr:histidyl-tRNA synthetase [Clostridia bacterium]
MLITRPRGTEDILPENISGWYLLEATARELSYLYGYREIRTPIFEHTEIFNRGVGDTTDIVEKEMYTFKDRGGRELTLRPEGTASVVRAFLEHRMDAQGLPVKLFYLGPMFRYGRPQAGRLRQFHQFGVEAFGSMDPGLDAEVIALAMNFYRALGLEDLELHLNSVGCPECRAKYREELKGYLEPYLKELCNTCQGRFERNPLRIFDCKSSVCQEIVAKAPTVVLSLCEDCSDHFKRVQGYLETLGIDFILDEHLVRGLDYYTKTAFEIMVKGIGAQSSIGGGGRYDGLVENLGGKSVPGIGFGLGLERVLLTLQAQGKDLPQINKIEVMVVTVGADLNKEAVRLLANLRAAGFKADKDYLERSLKAQMKYANRCKARIALILGEEEFKRGKVLVRDLETGSQEEVPLEEVVDFCRQKKESGW